MDIEQQLEIELSKGNMELICNYVGNNQQRFNELMSITLKRNDRLSWRAAWAIVGSFEKYPELIIPHIKTICREFLTETNTSILRNYTKILMGIDIPEDFESEIFDRCENVIMSSTQSIAVRANCMTIAYNISQKYPELKPELKLIIEDSLEGGSAGIKNRGGKLVAKLAKEIEMLTT